MTRFAPAFIKKKNKKSAEVYMSFHRCALFCTGASIHFHTNTDDCDLISEEVRRLAGAMASFQRRARGPRSHGDVQEGGGSSVHLLSCSSMKNDRKCEFNFKKRWDFSPTSTSPLLLFFFCSLFASSLSFPSVSLLCVSLSLFGGSHPLCSRGESLMVTVA